MYANIHFVYILYIGGKKYIRGRGMGRYVLLSTLEAICNIFRKVVVR